jgi:hypothetical protein
MRAKPNKTIVTGWLRTYEPAPDGYGGDIEVEVIANTSPDAASDFLRSAPGQSLRAFYAQPAPPATALPFGRRVRVELTFLGGPGGGRPVVQSITAE